MKGKRKYLAAVLLVLLSVMVLWPAKVNAETVFEEVPVYVTGDMRDYDQVIGLSWNLQWNLNRDAGVSEQCRYGKFTLEKDSFVRIKMSTVDSSAFASDEYFRLYGNESMAVPITDNTVSLGSGDDYLLLKAGTYYMQCGSKLNLSSVSSHSTKIMIGAVAEAEGVVVEQTVSADRKSVALTVTQKFATKLGKAKWCEGKVTGMVYQGEEMDTVNPSFTVTKNGWYTVYLKSESSVAFNEDVEYYAYIQVTGIGEGAKKGVTYKSGNLKYKLVKEGFDGTGTVMVTGMVKQKTSVTIPETVSLAGQSYQVVKINSKAFYKKSKVKKVTIQSKLITSIGKNAFKGIHKKAVFKVPKAQYKAYKKLLTAKTGFVKKTMKVKK
ncbi:MAG: leucine-rich repeat domain-containing protein [Clostridium sp.]|nr:leucine-rich repeat domain-containing protein [Clostridium sp.]